MKKTNALAMLAAVVLAGGALMAADNRVGVGIGWGVGYELFDDARMVGVSQIIDLEFQMDTGLTLFVHTEQQSVSADDGNNGSSEGKITYGGIGLNYNAGDWVSAGISVGKADASFDNGDDVTSPYAQINLAVHMLNNKGKGKVDYRATICLNYRFVMSGDVDINGNGDAASLSGFQAALQLGIGF